MLSSTVSSALQAIYQGLEEQRQIINTLKRYEDIIYSIVARRLSFLKQELAAIFGVLPEA